MGGEIKNYSPWKWIAGVMIAVIAGFCANVLVGAATLEFGRVAMIVALLAPGGFLAFVSLVLPKNGWSQGLLHGACCVALVGGVCGGVLGR